MTKHVVYVGGFDAVEIEVAPGRWRTVARGESIEVADRLAASLCEQEENWQPAAKASKSAKED